MRALMPASLAAAMIAFKASAAVTIVPLGVIVVPPTQTSSPGVTFAAGGSNSAYYEFAISQPNTFAASSFTNTAVQTKGFFNFTSIGLYSGFGTSGTLLETGSVSGRLGGTETAFLSPSSLGVGSYTIAYSGTVTGAPASVGSSITFAAGAVPDPAEWMLMVVGFGLVGVSTRRRGSRSAVAA